MGHVRVYSLGDAIARATRMMGYETLFPIGWDSFGLPAENAARDSRVDPALWTAKNIQTMRTQLASLNLSFDWEATELRTSDPTYYKWTPVALPRAFQGEPCLPRHGGMQLGPC